MIQKPPRGAALSEIRAWDQQQARERQERIDARSKAIADLNTDIALAQWKAATAILKAYEDDPLKAESAIEAAVGHGITDTTSRLLQSLVWTLYVEAAAAR